jgi:CspA family cold shock protein
VSIVATGTVKWFDTEKGHGFIVPDSGGTPLFVHHSAIVGADHKTLALDSRVQYEPGEGEFGPEAKDVTSTSVAGTSA